MITYQENDAVIFREKDLPNPREGVVARLYAGSEQMGISYDQGSAKVWISLKDVEILRLT